MAPAKSKDRLVMRKAVLVAFLVGIVMALVAACGNSRAILYKGQQTHLSGARIHVSDAQARRAGRDVLSEWREELAHRAGVAPAERFRNLSRADFMRRLARASARAQFVVESVRFEHPRQLAPRVVISTTHYLAVARAIAFVQRSLDPHHGSDDRLGWAYEGFYLEAQDERGIPFVIVSNALRGPDPEGSQWARSEELYPFGHF
jgi:hypothetical protein